MAKNILVTGGAGFIGRHLVAALLNDYHHVTVIDNLSTGRMDNINPYIRHPRFIFIDGDARDPIVMDSLISKANVVFNLAASVGVQKIFNDPIDCIENNTQIGSLILKLCSQYNTRLFMFSTSEIYGKNATFPFREDADITIGPYDKLRWGYACSKVLDDFLARAYFEKRQLPVTIVRLFNTIGANQSGDYGMVVPRLITQALEHAPLTVYGTGLQSRCFTDVRDVVSVLIKLIDKPESIGELINIGTSHEISVLDLAKKIIDLTQSSSEIKMIPYEIAYGQGFEDMNRRVASTEKLSTIMGHVFEHNLDDTLTWIYQDLIGPTSQRLNSLPLELTI